MLKRRRLVFAAVFVLLVALFGYSSWYAYERINRDALNAELVVNDVLLSPSTAKYLDVKILDKRGDYRLARVVVDSANGFGAVIRGQYCVIWRYGLDRKIHWLGTTGIMGECKEDVSSIAIDLFEKDNRWPAY